MGVEDLFPRFFLFLFFPSFHFFLSRKSSTTINPVRAIPSPNLDYIFSPENIIFRPRNLFDLDFRLVILIAIVLVIVICRVQFLQFLIISFPVFPVSNFLRPNRPQIRNPGIKVSVHRNFLTSLGPSYRFIEKGGPAGSQPGASSTGCLTSRMSNWKEALGLLQEMMHQLLTTDVVS